MTKRADQLHYIQSSFKKLARFKIKTFNHRQDVNSDYLEVIPLSEGVENQFYIKRLLEDYTALHIKEFGRKPHYLRPFIARSDPALISGLVATVLANKVALSGIYHFTMEQKIPTYPILGAGSLVFRGGLSPENINNFVNEYKGVKTATIQSAFRYDFPLSDVKESIKKLHNELPKNSAVLTGPADRKILISVIKKFELSYQQTIKRIIKDLGPIFEAVPKRRERRQHIGFLSYKRDMKNTRLPRAINFVAAFYSLGVPPEFMGVGRALQKLSFK